MSTTPITPYILNNPELTRRIANGEQMPQQQPQGLATPPAIPQGPLQPDMHVQVTHTTPDEGPDLGTTVPGRLAPFNSVAQPKPLIPPPPTVPKSPSELAHEAEYARLTAPPPTDKSLLHTKANTGASGIQQIHNPIGRGLLTIADAIGGGLFPSIAMGIPGTALHHRLLVNEQRGPLQQEELERNREEQQRLEEAKAQHQMSMENRTAEAKPAGTVHEDEQGNYWVIHPDGSATQVAPQGQPLKGKTKEETGGTVHEDADGNIWVVKGNGEALPVKPKGATETAPPPAPGPVAGIPPVTPPPT